MSGKGDDIILSYGVIPVYIDSKGNKEYLVVKNHDGFWGFPKGGADNDETPAETASRELKEETGLIVVANNLIENVSYEYKMPTPNGTKDKTVYLFPAIVDTKEVKLQQSELKNYKWATLETALELIDLKTLKDAIKRMPNI